MLDAVLLARGWVLQKWHHHVFNVKREGSTSCRSAWSCTSEFLYLSNARWVFHFSMDTIEGKLAEQVRLYKHLYHPSMRDHGDSQMIWIREERSPPHSQNMTFSVGRYRRIWGIAMIFRQHSFTSWLFTECFLLYAPGVSENTTTDSTLSINSVQACSRNLPYEITITIITVLCSCKTPLLIVRGWLRK